MRASIKPHATLASCACHRVPPTQIRTRQPTPGSGCGYHAATQRAQRGLQHSKPREGIRMTSDLWREARDAYLAEHPRPNAFDFACPRCQAPPGELSAGVDGTGQSAPEIRVMPVSRNT
jgi:hypothetical protein